MRRYRRVILGAGTLAQSSFSAVAVGLPALAPVLRSHHHLSLAQVGFVLGAVSLGMLPTLLPGAPVAELPERTLDVSDQQLLARRALAHQ